MVRGQHSDSKARAQRCIQKAAEDHLVLQQQERINAFCFTDKTKTPQKLQRWHQIQTADETHQIKTRKQN